MTALTSLLSATLALGSAAAPLPSYLPLDPAKLILQADLIVEGTITRADAPRVTLEQTLDSEHSATFTIHVDEVLVGKIDQSELVVGQFADWACASRYAPYERGQRAVFHLQRARNEKGEVDPTAPLWVMGGGNEGECPIVGPSVFHQANGVTEGNRRTHEPYGHKFVGIVVPKGEFAEAVRGLSRRYTWSRDATDPLMFRPEQLHQACSDDSLATFRGSSTTAKQMLTAVERILRGRR